MRWRHEVERSHRKRSNRPLDCTFKMEQARYVFISSPDLAKKHTYITTVTTSHGWVVIGLHLIHWTFSLSESFSYSFQSGIPRGGETHGGEDVPVYARGPRSHLLSGIYEQNYIQHAIIYAAELGRTTRTASSVSSAAGTVFIHCGLLTVKLIFVRIFSWVISVCRFEKYRLVPCPTSLPLLQDLNQYVDRCHEGILNS
jgi:hypothetical protein